MDTNSRVNRSVLCKTIDVVLRRPEAGIAENNTKPCLRSMMSSNCCCIFGLMPRSSRLLNWTLAGSNCKSTRSPVGVPWLASEAAWGVTGSVQKVEIFTTTLLTPDNKEVIVPNSAIISSSITNYSSTGQRRVDMVFGVGYSDDLKKVRQVIEEVLATEDRILNEPATQVAVSNLGESSVDFVVRPWVNTPDYWDVMFNITEKMKLRFDEEGISIPFPQQDVHLISAPSEN